jgi:type I restriction enzyme, S subunit
MGEPPGDADVYPTDQPSAVITADCIKIRCQSDLMVPAFLKAVINSHIGRRQIEPITQGVAQKKVSLGRFVGLAIPVPPIDEQSSIVQMLWGMEREAEAQLRAIELSLKQSAAQRQNILRAAFAGELVPQDPNDESANVLLERIRSKRAEHSKQPRVRNVMRSKGMQKPVSESVAAWISAQKEIEFSFEDLRGGVHVEYDVLKDEMFRLLASPSPIIGQVFDQASGALRFRKKTR